MIRISLNDIRKQVNSVIFKRGVKYYNHGHVIKIDSDGNVVTTQVKGMKIYEVVMEFQQDTGNILYTQCNCPAHYGYYGPCKHIIASLLSVLYNQEKLNRNITSHINDNMINSFSKALTYNSSTKIQKCMVDLDITIMLMPTDIRWNEQPTTFQFRIGDKRLYLIKNMKIFLKNYKDNQSMLFGKEFTYNHDYHKFNPINSNIIDILRDYHTTEQYLLDANTHYYYTSKLTSSIITLPENYLHKLLDLLTDKFFSIKYGNEIIKNKKILQDINMKFNVKHSNLSITIEIESESDIFKLDASGLYVYYNNNIYKLTTNQVRLFNVILKSFDLKNKSLTLEHHYKHQFVSSILPVLEQLGTIKLDSKLTENIYQENMVCEIYLDKYNDSIKGSLSFNYGPYKFGVYPPSKPEIPHHMILAQDLQTENKILGILKESNCVAEDTFFTIYGENELYDFIYYYLPILQETCTIYYSDAFKNIHVAIPPTISGGVRLNENSDLLEFNFAIDGINKDEILEVLKSIKEKKRYYKLQNGGFLPLDSEETKSIADLIDHLHIPINDYSNEIVNLPKYRALYIDSILRDCKIKSFRKNQSFKKLVQDIKEPQDMNFKPPNELDNILRDYQKFGFKWLKTLSIYNLGGILADDMGLGKTLQAITLIKSSSLIKPSLVVAPTSLVYNWVDEINKFSPDLRVILLIGKKSDRDIAFSNIADNHVVITSYGLLKRDIEKYQSIHFEYCFIDEAQHIKNPNSQNAKCTKQINAEVRFALTGTPIENTLTELWSIFDFILPGFLLTHSKFVNNYEKPIIKLNDSNALNALTRQVKPFILRRLKIDVLKELPPKIESKIATELTSHQKKLYLAYLEQTKREIHSEINDKGFNKSRMKILSALTRLRQICCHPSLFIDDYRYSSGKMELLEEIVVDAISSNHRILIFSQFTSMLKLIETMLKSNNITYFYLDGSTKPIDRRNMVLDFNNGEKEVFLISLKAGGTGLNLTGADMVIHYDPWWNPAVEDQATDRAYRIGQNKSVQVIKLITNGTIEEKIYKLQQQKKSIIDAVIKPGETLLTKLSEEEVRNILEIY